MALSDDQRAMLRLLAQREQGYEDMAALMGVSVEELRGRVREALGELEREGKEAPPLPPEPAVAAPPPAEDPEPAAAEPAPAPAAPPPPPASKPGSGPSILASKGARIGIAAVAAAIVVVVVLLLVLGGGGSDSATTTTSAGATAPGATIVQKAVKAAEARTGQKEVTKAILSGVEGSEAEGIAIFGRVKNKLALQVVADGLEPLAHGESYAIWIAASPNKMLPLAASPVNKKGQIASQFEVPTEVLAYLATETFNEIAITKASISQLDAALKSATKAKKPPAYTGTPVLRGTITGPIIGAAKRLEEEKAAGSGKK
ncbi:MAG: hypothetical protein JST31_04800 [Actinobacteria bacterium]|nr:hypothetical protein [Actinomycetota bacterium]